MPAGYEAIEAFLARVRMRLLCMCAARAGAAIAAFVSVSAIVLMLAARDEGMAGKAAAAFVFCLVAFVAAVAIFHVYPLVAAMARAGRISRLVEAADPSLRGALLAATELRHEMSAPAAAALYSATLAKLHIESVAGRLQGVEALKLFPARPLVRTVWLSILLLAAASIAAIVSPEASRRSLAAVLAIFSGSPQEGAFADLPLAGDIKLTYHFPQYTGLAPRTVEGSDGSIAALKGTEVEISARCEAALRAASIVVEGKEMPASVSATELNGRLMVLGHSSYRFKTEQMSVPLHNLVAPHGGGSLSQDMAAPAHPPCPSQ